MIIFALAIFVILTFVSIIYISNKTLSNILGVIFFALVIGSISLIMLNDHNHFGMEKSTETKTSALVSTTPQKGMNMLLYQEVGTKGKENTYIYRTDSTEKKPKHTKVDSNVTNSVVVNNDQPKVVKQSKYYVYKSSFMKFLFGISGNNHQLISIKNTFYVNKDWLVLSTKQAKELQTKMKDPNYQAQLKAQGADYAKKAVEAAVKKNKKINAAQKNQVAQNAAKQFQAMKMEELIKSVMKK